MNQCNRTPPRCDQITPSITPSARDFVVPAFPFIVLVTIERKRLALGRSAEYFPSGHELFGLGKNRIAAIHC